MKTVSSENLARFKAKCDETYAAIDNIPTVSTELVNLGTLSTSGTLTADQATQIGTTTVGVTARASVNSVTRFYERVNISGTTAMLVSADDDALHVLTVNLSTRAYTLSDVELGGGITNAEVIEYAEQLPTASETSPNFVQTPDGTLYRKKAVESVGLLGTWVFNDTLTLSGRNTFNVSFTSNDNSYTQMSYITGVADDLSYGGEIVYSDVKGMGGWNNTAFKTINITDISALTNIEEFTTLITANATGGSASVSYEYVAMQEVPTPTTADNGKVISVENGEYILKELTNEIIDVGTLQLGSNSISSDLFNKIKDVNNYVFKFTFTGETQYAFRSSVLSAGAYPTYYFRQSLDTGSTSGGLLSLYNITLNPGGYSLNIQEIEITEFATVDECAEAFNPSAVQLISFIVAGNTYNAESGMTWQQFVDSDYNNDGTFFITGNTVNTTLGGGRPVDGVVPNDLIYETTYQLQSGGTVG